MKTILIPTDFSNNAYCALDYAAQLFAKEKCKLIIVHSFENQVSNLTSRIDIGKTESVVDDLYETYESKCDEVKHKIILDTENSLHTYETIVTSMALSKAVNKLIKKEDVDFVVMGSKGSTGASDFLLGSNTLRMIQKIKKASLLVVPQQFDFKPVKKIAFATGFKREYSEKEIEPLTHVSSLSDATVDVIHVNKEENMTEDQLANYLQLFELLKDNNPKNNWLSDENDIYDAITSYLNKKEIDLLVMIYYKHNAIVRLFREATIKDIAKYTLIPFLILPKQDA